MATDASDPLHVDITWLARVTFAGARDRPTSAWLPPGQRVVGRRFNDPIRPDWMDDAEWELRDTLVEPPAVSAAATRLKRVLCEAGGRTPSPEVVRLHEP